MRVLTPAEKYGLTVVNFDLDFNKTKFSRKPQRMCYICIVNM